MPLILSLLPLLQVSQVDLNRDKFCITSAGCSNTLSYRHFNHPRLDRLVSHLDLDVIWFLIINLAGFLVLKPVQSLYWRNIPLLIRTTRILRYFLLAHHAGAYGQPWDEII